jgi:hypothetical protein
MIVIDAIVEIMFGIDIILSKNKSYNDDSSIPLRVH